MFDDSVQQYIMERQTYKIYFKSVFIKPYQQGPGATQLIRMPKLEISADAAPFVNAAIAALVVA
jgi:hypothetical protein